MQAAIATTAPVVHFVGIDTLSSNQRQLMKDLNALKTTVWVCDGGVYREDTSMCQIHVQTLMTEKELDNWLWANNADYLGTFIKEDLDHYYAAAKN